MATKQNVAASLAPEFDIIKTNLGYTMAGWDFTRKELARAINGHRMLNPAFELGTNFCPWNCGFCFTEEPGNPEGDKRRLSNEMTLEERLSLIDQAAALGTRSINFVGAGEPTIDPKFWDIIERMRHHNITPIVYTEGALRLTDKAFVKRLYDSEVTVVLKVNSLWNEQYQNAIVAGPPDRKRPRSENYFQQRKIALDNLIEAGFNKHDPTRLAFDTIICKQNRDEIADLHRWARKQNIFILFVNYLPSGRSSDGLHDALSRQEQFEIFAQLAEIDEKEFGIKHVSRFPYAGGTPCTIRGFGLFVKITGATHDCPGELISMGDVRTEPLQAIWERARPITQNFDGGCEPREEFWRTHEKPTGSRVLPVLQSI